MSKVVTGLLKLFFGTKSDKDKKAVMPYIEKVHAIYPQIEALTHDELRARSEALKAKIQEAIASDEKRIESLKAEMESTEISIEKKSAISKEIDDALLTIDETIEKVLLEILPEAFAIVKDTGRRLKEADAIEVTATDFDRMLALKRDNVTIEGDKAIHSSSWLAGGNMMSWDMVHYDSQLFGGVVLHTGKIAEMATGEGKTLVATLPVFLNALAGKGVHVVTVNDYLARRDSEWMGPLFEFHGMSVDCIDKHQPNSPQRRAAYMSDITYGTNNEFGFDYLRDNMANSVTDLVQKKHHFAIVDEVDSVLIDDARTPLIISGPVPRGDVQMFDQYRDYIDKLYNMQKSYVTSIISESRKLIAAGKTEEGGILLFRAHKGLPKYRPLIKFLSEQGIKTLMQKVENIYTAENNKRLSEIVDDLFFVIEEKNNSVDLTDKGLEVLSQSVNDSNFFVLPDIGTEIADLTKSDLSTEEKVAKKDALMSDYTLKSERVHTVNQLLKAYSLFEKDVEYVVMDNKVKIVDEQTGRIMDGRRYSDGLHQAIEAKERVTVEAATQTFATVTLQNYFRMYHKLGGMTGTAETEASEFWSIYKLDVVSIPTNRPIQRDDRHDLIYKTKREKYQAVIDEIVELVEQKRPVLVGTTSVEISELLSKMLKMRGISHNVLNAKQHQQEAQVVQEAGRAGQVTIATNMAGRGTDIKLSKEVKDAGGLAIIGTERHESRRVDRQLRGRSGRQGDPGSSQFFLSLEDDLMRLFGTERIAGLMDRMGFKEGENIQAPMISRAVEKAQKKVEENNFGVRKRLLEYDDVMNSQREVIYRRRRHALYGDRVEVDINNMVVDFAEAFVTAYGSSYEDFHFELIRQLSVDTTITEDEFNALNHEDKQRRVAQDITDTLDRRREAIASIIAPVAASIKEQQGDRYKLFPFPVADGTRMFHAHGDIDKIIATKGQDAFNALSKIVMLIMIDESWKEHLREMDDLKQSVQNASYEQKDPLLIYKFESYNLFSKMLDKVNREILSILTRAYVPVRQAPQPQPQPQVRMQPAAAPAPSEQPKVEPKSVINSAASVGMRDMNAEQEKAAKVAAAVNQGDSKPSPAKADKRVGRNDACPCGSGQKYKSCCGN